MASGVGTANVLNFKGPLRNDQSVPSNRSLESVPTFVGPTVQQRVNLTAQPSQMKLESALLLAVGSVRLQSISSRGILVIQNAIKSSNSGSAFLVSRASAVLAMTLLINASFVGLLPISIPMRRAKHFKS